VQILTLELFCFLLIYKCITIFTYSKFNFLIILCGHLSEFVESSESISIFKHRLKTELFPLVLTSCTASCCVSQ